jgi:hypothetical protein
MKLPFAASGKQALTELGIGSRSVVVTRRLLRSAPNSGGGSGSRA